jgi:hypothetical protein
MCTYIYFYFSWPHVYTCVLICRVYVLVCTCVFMYVCIVYLHVWFVNVYTCTIQTIALYVYNVYKCVCKRLHFMYIMYINVLHAGICRYVQVYTGICRCMQVYAGICRYMQVYVYCECARAVEWLLFLTESCTYMRLMCVCVRARKHVNALHTCNEIQFVALFKTGDSSHALKLCLDRYNA